MSLSPSLRKAAVLISVLDESDAEAILVQMGPEESAKIRSAFVELDEISTEEQDRVLAEFLHHQRRPALGDGGSGVELELDPAVEARVADDAEASVSTSSSPRMEAPFEFLENIDPAALAALLSREHPQMVAAILAQLTPRQAAALLERLPAELATDALERTALIDELSLEVKSDLADELRLRLAPFLRANRAGPAHLARVSAVLGAMDQKQRQSAVKHLAERNRALSRRLGIVDTGADPPPAETNGEIAFRYRLDSSQEMTPQKRTPSEMVLSGAPEFSLRFQDIALLNEADLRAVFAHSDAETILLALTGAEPRFLDRILRHLPGRDANVLRKQLDYPGPIRLNEIEQARAELLRTTHRLVHGGLISAPRSMRVYAAV